MKQPMTLQEMLEKRTVSKLMRQTFSATVCPPVQIPEGMTELELSKTEELGKVVNKETDESIVRTYRALSAALLPGIFIDFGAKDGKVLKNAMKHFRLTPIEEDIILKHMWPLTIKLPRYRESYLVSLADKIVSIKDTLGFTKRKERK